MPWWAWLVVGGALLAAEAAVQTEFWLAVLGFAAVVQALLVLGELGGPIWVQWLTFASLSIFLAVFVRRKIVGKLVGAVPGIRPELLGETPTVTEEIAPDRVGSVELRGSVWRARNVGERTLTAGSSPRVVNVDGAVLEISE